MASRATRGLSRCPEEAQAIDAVGDEGENILPMAESRRAFFVSLPSVGFILLVRLETGNC